MASNGVNGTLPSSDAKGDCPIAIIGIANRLPGDSNTPSQLWNFLLKGGVAGNDPRSRDSASRATTTGP